MNAVVHASVLVAAVLDAGPVGVWAERILGSGHHAAPHAAPVQAAEIIARLERAGRIGKLEAGSAARDVQDLDLRLYPVKPFGTRVWELRESLAPTAAWYVVLAEALQVPLATLDTQMASVPGPRCRFYLRA